MDRKAHINFWYVVAALFALMAIQSWWTSYTQVETIPYSEFEDLLKKDQIEEVQVGPNSLQGKLKKPLPDGRQFFEATRVDRGLAEDLTKYNVKFAGKIPNTFIRDLLSWVIPAVAFFAIWMFIVRRMAEKQGIGGLMSIGKSKAKVYVEKDTKTTFDDVAGVDEAKDELREIVSFRKIRTRRGPFAQGGAPCRAARDRQDPSGPRRGRRGGRAVFLHLGLGIRRDVRRCRRGPRARSLRAGAQGGAMHHLY